MTENNTKLHFKFMSFKFKIRDFFKPPKKILKKLGVKSGYYVLDFGCGPASYSIAASKLAGSNGEVYALDINPLAIDRLKKFASSNDYNNIKTILSDCITNLDDNSIDIILLFDVYHELDNKIQVLKELYRVLKPGGTLCVTDHHFPEEKILSEIIEIITFKFMKKIDKYTIFQK